MPIATDERVKRFINAFDASRTSERSSELFPASDDILVSDDNAVVWIGGDNTLDDCDLVDFQSGRTECSSVEYVEGASVASDPTDSYRFDGTNDARVQATYVEALRTVLDTDLDGLVERAWVNGDWYHSPVSFDVGDATVVVASYVG